MIPGRNPGRRSSWRPLAALGRVFYLDNSHQSASDANPGTSPTAPLATMGAIGALNLQPGDTVRIKAGTSYTGTVWIEGRNGTANAPITITRYGTGANPSLSSTANRPFVLQNCSYVVVEWLKIAAAKEIGIFLGGTTHHCTVQRCECTNVAFGVWTLGHHNRLLHNYVHDTIMWINTVGGDDDTGGVAFVIEGDDMEVAYNYCLRCKAPSNDYGTDGGAFETWRSVSNLSIHDNWIEECSSVLEIGGQTGDVVSGVEVYNNVSWNCVGFHWIHNDTSVGNYGISVTGVNVHHNTIVEQGADTWILFGFGVAPTGGAYTASRNLVYCPNTDIAWHPDGAYHTNNFYQVAVMQPGTGEVSGTANFANLAGGDFHPSGTASGYGAYSNGGVPSRIDPTLPAENRADSVTAGDSNTSTLRALTVSPSSVGTVYAEQDGLARKTFTVTSKGMSSISWVVMTSGFSWRHGQINVGTSGSVTITPGFVATGDLLRVWDTSDLNFGVYVTGTTVVPLLTRTESATAGDQHTAS